MAAIIHGKTGFVVTNGDKFIYFANGYLLKFSLFLKEYCLLFKLRMLSVKIELHVLRNYDANNC